MKYRGAGELLYVGSATVFLCKASRLHKVFRSLTRRLTTRSTRPRHGSPHLWQPTAQLYDEWGGAVEANIKEDKQGFGVVKRRKLKPRRKAAHGKNFVDTESNRE
jgi:hypothetical protein